ncbi:30S ribosomal protein S4 [Candidatus Woesebacteria bacterium]|nr:30S ribosomal protein S4 [Candidatus Woesebacteria bacterium]
MRYTGPKNKAARREGMDLGLKTTGSKSHASLLKRLNISPGQHGVSRRRKKSEHSRQLREKQKLRYMFGLTEKQLKRYFLESARKKGNTAVHMTELLERRLDNVVYRLGLAPTRAAARQLVVHKHIKVNDKVLSIPSYQLKNKDSVTFAKTKTKAIPYIEESLKDDQRIMPEWLSKKADAGTLVATPDTSFVDQQVNLRLVVEFYSR